MERQTRPRARGGVHKASRGDCWDGTESARPPPCDVDRKQARSHLSLEPVAALANTTALPPPSLSTANQPLPPPPLYTHRPSCVPPALKISPCRTLSSLCAPIRASSPPGYRAAAQRLCTPLCYGAPISLPRPVMVWQRSPRPCPRSTLQRCGLLKQPSPAAFRHTHGGRIAGFKHLVHVRWLDVDTGSSGGSMNYIPLPARRWFNRPCSGGSIDHIALTSGGAVSAVSDVLPCHTRGDAHGSAIDRHPHIAITQRLTLWQHAP